MYLTVRMTSKCTLGRLVCPYDAQRGPRRGGETKEKRGPSCHSAPALRSYLLSDNFVRQSISWIVRFYLIIYIYIYRYETSSECVVPATIIGCARKLSEDHRDGSNADVYFFNNHDVLENFSIDFNCRIAVKRRVVTFE